MSSHTVAATWTAVILNSSATSGPLSNGRILKMCSLEVYIQSLEVKKGGSLEPPRTPPAYGPEYDIGIIAFPVHVHRTAGIPDLVLDDVLQSDSSSLIGEL